MENKEGVYNINFFKKVWYSITKFEKYPAMASEGLGRAIKYLCIMVAIVTVFAVIGSIIEMNKLVRNLSEYINENIPEFTYENGKITTDLDETMIIDEVQYNGIDRVVIDVLSETDDEKNSSQQENSVEGVTIFFFRDQIILRSQTSSGESAVEPYVYNDFIASYTGEQISKFDKQELVQYLVSSKMSNFYTRYGISIFIYLLVNYILIAIIDVLELAILGWITAIVARIKMRFVAIYNMAVYAMTLPMILNMLYIAINYFIDFKITYFQVAYLTIAYIYLAAVIFIIKDDAIKQMQEVVKIKEEQKKVREEIKSKEKNPEDKPKKQKPKEKKEEENENEDTENKNEGQPNGAET